MKKVNRKSEMAKQHQASKTEWREADIAKLAELETEIANERLSFIRKGKALKAVKARILHFAAGYKTFAEYCQQRWEISHAQVYRLLKAVDTYEAVSKLGTKPLPSNEAQCRELARLKVKDSTERQARLQQEAWVLAVRLSNGEQPTQAVVAEAVRSFKPKKASKSAQLKRAAFKRFEDATGKFATAVMYIYRVLAPERATLSIVPGGDGRQHPQGCMAAKQARHGMRGIP